jgi:hypothetical protein
LHVSDLAVPERKYLVPLDVSALVVAPDRRPDDLVAHLRELRPNLRRLASTVLDLEPQDLTGLVRAASARDPLPPEMTDGDSSPLCVVGKERNERLRVALVESLCRCSKLLDHSG